MEQATVSTVMQKIDTIRSSNPFALSNIMDYQTLSNAIEKKECFIVQHDLAILILIPYHNLYYDILYCADNADTLKIIINIFKSIYDKDYYVHVGIIGKENHVISISNIFKECCFTLTKKYARMYTIINKKSKASEANVYFNGNKKPVAKKTDVISKPSSKVTHKYITSFAHDGEEDQILSLLLEEFDISDETVPELDTIREHIKNKQIIVVKHIDNIVALLYFEIKNKTYYGIFEMSKKEYRHEFLMYYIYEFRLNYFNKNKMVFNRFVGWRNKENKRLMKYSALNNEFPDGIYIYNLKWNGK